MRISKGLKTGLIVGSSIIGFGGLIMGFVGGLPSFNSVEFKLDPKTDKVIGTDISGAGIGLLNFDNKPKEGPFFIPSMDPNNSGTVILKTETNIILQNSALWGGEDTFSAFINYCNKITDQEKTQMHMAIDQAKAEIEKIDTSAQYKFAARAYYESEISFLEAILIAPIYYGVAVAGFVLMPLGLITLILALCLKSKKKEINQAV